MTRVIERAIGMLQTAETGELVALARERIGLKPDFCAAKIEALLRATPDANRDAFCRMLAASAPKSLAWRAFAETLLVHETYFFRHPDQLHMLETELLPQLIKDRLDAGSNDLRIWCPGCSSGEEVYTLALIVQAAVCASALGKESRSLNVTILGTDLSSLTLEVARRGKYTLTAGLNSFRDVPESAKRHFHSIFGAGETSWTADADLRQLTRFAQHNLVVDPAPISDVDLVVCRNALIYFEEEAWRIALSTLESALRAGGALLLGPAETTTEESNLELVCSEQTVFWVKRMAR